LSGGIGYARQDSPPGVTGTRALRTMAEFIDISYLKLVVAAAFLASIACGIVGTLVVVNRMVFLAGGIAHAAYGGVGISFYFGLPMFPSVLGIAAVSSGVLGFTGIRVRHRSDAIIGAIWATGMSIGVILINMTPGYHGDVMSYLFGSVITILPSDLLIIGLLDLILILWITIFYREILAVSYDPEFATIAGIHVSTFYYSMLFFCAGTIVVLMRFVGLILVIALLSIPPCMVEPIVPSLGRMFFVCTFLNFCFFIAGLLTSLWFNFQAGPTIILVASGTFILAELVRRISKNYG